MLIAVLDELMDASQRLARGRALRVRVTLHGTPLELAISRRARVVILKIVEVVDYRGPERTLGEMRMSSHGFLHMISDGAEGFVNELRRANRAFANHVGLECLRSEARQLLHMSS